MVVRVEALGKEKVELQVLVAGAGGKFGDIRFAFARTLAEPLETIVRMISLSLRMG